MAEYVELCHWYDPLRFDIPEHILTTIIDSYPDVAASAIAAFMVPSFVLAAALSHLGILMIDNMTVKWAMAVIGFVSFGLCGLVYILYFFGAKIRKRSKFAGTS